MANPGALQQNSGAILSPLCCVPLGNNSTSQVLFPQLKNENENKDLPNLLQEKQSYVISCAVFTEHLLYAKHAATNQKGMVGSVDMDAFCPCH